jgi:beta-lactamase class C
LTIKTKLPTRVAIALICSYFFPLTSFAADDAMTAQSIVDTAIHPLMTEYDVPGMVVAVTVDGKARFFNYGVASKEQNTPVSEATLFEIGSLSKTFTATLASYAQVQGKLSLDDHPGKYMPQLKGSAIDKASLKNLGTFTAGGLPLQFPDAVEGDHIIDYFQHWKADAAPGTQRRYSNPSLGLFGYITALALKSDFSDAIESQLFPQLGLKGSYIRVPDSAMADYAWGYNKENKPIRVNLGAFGEEAYGVKSSAADMIRFVQINIEPNLLEGPMQRAVDGTHVGYFKSGELVQGLGWEQYPYPVTLERLLSGNDNTMIYQANTAKQLTPPRAPSGPTLFDKTGSTNGFGAYIAFVPAKKIGIVLLANKNVPIPARIKAAYAILERLAPLTR